MVSSVLDMGVDELVQALGRLRAERGDDPEYRQWRAQFPADWPM